MLVHASGSVEVLRFTWGLWHWKGPVSLPQPSSPPGASSGTRPSCLCDLLQPVMLPAIAGHRDGAITVCMALNGFGWQEQGMHLPPGVIPVAPGRSVGSQAASPATPARQRRAEARGRGAARF